MTEQLLSDLLIHELRILIDTENQIRDALTQLHRLNYSSLLRELFSMETSRSDTHRSRLQQIFNLLLTPPVPLHCSATSCLVDGLLQRVFTDMKPGAEADLSLLTFVQRIQASKLTSYRTAHIYAKTLRVNELAALLSSTIEEIEMSEHDITQSVFTLLERRIHK